VSIRDFFIKKIQIKSIFLNCNVWVGRSQEVIKQNMSILFQTNMNAHYIAIRTFKLIGTSYNVGFEDNILPTVSCEQANTLQQCQRNCLKTTFSMTLV